MSPGKRAPRNLSDVDPDSFGAIIRRRREEAGMSQEELGVAIGADQARVSAYENNRFKPNEEMLIALAQALHVPAGLLFESSQWGGLLPVGPERREKLKQLHEADWRMFDHVLEVIGDIAPEQRATFERGFEQFLKEWR